MVKLYHRGHTGYEIAAALDLSPSQAADDLRRLVPGRTKRFKGRGPVTIDCPWRDEDLPAAERDVPALSEMERSRWRQSRIVGMAQMLNDEYRETNFANILANQVTDAETAGDDQWQLLALATFSAAIEKLERARRVLSDEAYRAACRDTLEGVEQMRRTSQLRIVTR